MFVGPDEEYIQKDFYLKYKNLKNYVTFVDFTETPEKYMAAADIFCLPSHREGFGMAALEAASTSLPVIYSNIYGLSDAVEKNLTGLAFEVRNIESLKKNLKILINEKNLRLNLGVKGRERVILKFNQKVVTSKFVKYFENLLI
jgi:glycosyltransferase involved in cell wall biosynthesis